MKVSEGAKGALRVAIKLLDEKAKIAMNSGRSRLVVEEWDADKLTLIRLLSDLDNYKPSDYVLELEDKIKELHLVLDSVRKIVN